MFQKETRKRIYWFAVLYLISLTSMALISIFIHFIVEELK